MEASTSPVLAPSARLILLHYSSSLEVLRLGSSQRRSGALGTVLPLSSQPEKVLEVTVKPAGGADRVLRNPS